MSIRVQESLMRGLGDLRREPTAKRIRALLGEVVVVDSTRAVLVWEPRRVVPSYAVPVADIAGELMPADTGPAAADDPATGAPMPDVSRRPVLDPSIPFGVHTADGTPADLRTAGRTVLGAALAMADPDLAGYALLDFAAFDGWLEEDEPNVGHPRDPFHRIDVLPSSRSLRLELDGAVLAESSRPRLLFEALLPTRYYIPRADVVAELVASPTSSTCAYKGHASYWSARVNGELVPDLAWSYEQPLHDAVGVGGLVAFFDERVDVVLDGVRRPRPVTPWSR